MKKAFVLAAAVALTGLAGASIAQDKQEQARTPEQQAEAQLTLRTARDLIAYGEAKNDPLALVTGAKMMTSIQGQVLADGEKGQNGKKFDVEGTLKKAEELAQGDELITKVAADVRKANEANSKWVCYWEYYYGSYYEVCYY